MHIAPYLKKWWQKAHETSVLENIQTPVRSCCLVPELNFTPHCEEMHAVFLNSNENWSQSPAQKWLPLSVKNNNDWAGLMCRCLQPQAKLQHHLEAGLTLPSEWAYFPERLQINVATNPLSPSVNLLSITEGYTDDQAWKSTAAWRAFRMKKTAMPKVELNHYGV